MGIEWNKQNQPTFDTILKIKWKVQRRPMDTSWGNSPTILLLDLHSLFFYLSLFNFLLLVSTILRSYKRRLTHMHTIRNTLDCDSRHIYLSCPSWRASSSRTQCSNGTRLVPWNPLGIEHAQWLYLTCKRSVILQREQLDWTIMNAGTSYE